MKCIIELKDCILLGKGAEGSVYLTPEGYALKIFNTINGAKNEADILNSVKSSKFFPNTIVRVSNILIREYVQGQNLYDFLMNNGISYKVSTEIIDLIEDLKFLKFKRINIRNAHIFIDSNENLMVIDPRKSFTKITPYPKDIIKILLKLDLFDEFLKHLISYNPNLLSYWLDGYNYVVCNYRHVLRYRQVHLRRFQHK